MKMQYYKLSPQRVRRVLHSPRRTEEGVAPQTIAIMQPVSVTTSGKQQSWKQEIWVMVQDTGKERRVISAWRYPGVTKPRGAADFLRKEYNEFLNASHESII